MEANDIQPLLVRENGDKQKYVIMIKTLIEKLANELDLSRIESVNEKGRQTKRDHPFNNKNPKNSSNSYKSNKVFQLKTQLFPVHSRQQWQSHLVIVPSGSA